MRSSTARLWRHRYKLGSSNSRRSRLARDAGLFAATPSIGEHGTHGGGPPNGAIINRPRLEGGRGESSSLKRDS